MTKHNATPSDDFNAAAENGAPELIFVDLLEGNESKITFKDVNIKTPLENTTLIKDINFTIQNGQRIGLTGPNGAGKSTIFRVMAELNSAGSGNVEITMPADKKIFIASQEIRKTPTTLPGLLAYPNRPETYTHEQYEQCLDDAGLEDIKVHLPWNLARPETLVTFFQKMLDQQLSKQAGKMSAHSAEAMANAIEKTIRKKLYLTELIEDHFTAEDQEDLALQMRAYAMDMLKCPADEHGKSPVFPGYKGRQAAKNMIANTNNAIENWMLQGHKMRLSGGQQQKLIFARMFLQCEEVGLFLLDEVTAALKEETAHELYGKLFEKAEGVTAISVIHNDNLLRHHTHHLELHEDKRLTLTDLQTDKPQSPSPSL
tara:strand:+ start:2291 stop:3406 length:1116 start_codon:yes stop_codon:yes gene_type:complete